MDRRHVGDRRVREPLEARADSPGPVGAGVVETKVVREVVTHDALVRGDDRTGRGVPDPWHLLGRHPAVPGVVGVTRHRPPGVRARANRYSAHGTVRDVAVDVGAHEVVHRVDPSAHHRVELVDVARPEHRQRDRQAGARRDQRRRTQCQDRPRARVAEHDRAEVGLGTCHGDRRRVMHDHRLLMRCRDGVRALDVEVLVVAVRVRHTPRDVLGVAEVREPRHADEREPDRVEGVAREMALVVDARNLEAPVRVAADERLPRRGA